MKIKVGGDNDFILVGREERGNESENDEKDRKIKSNYI